ncbi:MAG: hypothetical protein OEY49_18140, partial [Candidatus Heimdallarchaeota archaeon]|nr:hypothetical protein [Candidatus Heimdallarchaeota archaeon]
YFEGEFFNETILQSITELLNKEPDIMNLCLQNGGAKPGILYLADKMELHSLNLLNSKIEESSIAIKIVPILHGG